MASTIRVTEFGLSVIQEFTDFNLFINSLNKIGVRPKLTFFMSGDGNWIAGITASIRNDAWSVQFRFNAVRGELEAHGVAEPSDIYALLDACSK